MCLELGHGVHFIRPSSPLPRLQSPGTFAINWLLWPNWLNFSNILKELQSRFPVSAAYVRVAEVWPEGKLCIPRAAGYKCVVLSCTLDRALSPAKSEFLLLQRHGHFIPFGDSRMCQVPG